MSFGRVFLLTQKRHIAFFAGLLVAAFGLMALGNSGLARVHAAAQDCDSNAIIYCGETTPSSFINQVKVNDSKNGHHDLQAVYAYYGLEPASYDKFVSYARQGTSYKDGRIVVDGQVVATNATSIGRNAAAQHAGYFTQNISGTNYYGNTNQQAFNSDSIPVMVMFDAKGVMQFAVLTSCGNPTTGKKITPNYACNLLNKAPVSGKANTYSFTTSATAGNNASIAKLVYEFGDGTTATTTNPSTPVTHTYTKGGTYTAKVTVYVKLPGAQQTTVTSGGCQTTITVTIPFYQCVQLAGAFLDQNKMSIRFVATASFGNGATFTGADIDFGDGTSANGVKPNGTTATVDHTYAKAGNYNAAAVLHFSANGQSVTAPTCKALVTPTTAPTPECKPGVPVGSPACTPCQYDTSLPANSPECVPPSLPNTGAGNVIAIGAAVAVGGFLIYRQILFRKHKAAFMAAEQGTSPLPLADPTSGTPLRDTPLAPRHKVFRRRRSR